MTEAQAHKQAARDYSAIPCTAPDYRKPGPAAPPPVLEFARVQPCYAGMDDTAAYAQTMSITAVDTQNAVDKLYEQGDLSEYAHSKLSELEEHYARQRLMSERPAPTPNGKWMGIAMDALEQIQELRRLIGELDFFSANTGLRALQQQSEKAKEVLLRAGMRL